MKIKSKIKNLTIISLLTFFLLLPNIGESEENLFLYPDLKIFNSRSLNEVIGGKETGSIYYIEKNKIILWDEANEAKKVKITQLNIFKGDNNIGYSTLIISSK
ncbi:hypothetical protein [Thermodesulfobacterium hydrogeniphilum]|uniref:hypothetical protein n=1 Tax=Thermodesulfobacterium hydrogeniphilum TaxID=161156 RepID=UPI00056F8E3D|nr:hypothetical protein [Thermodesulfobacterium hydrogeniphilum]